MLSDTDMSSSLILGELGLDGTIRPVRGVIGKLLHAKNKDLQLSIFQLQSRIHSLSSRKYDTIITERPFRAPHHSSSDISIIGGGTNPRPGEISLSHHDVLLFDEFPEFNRSTIEALRQPLEDRLITVARAKDTVSFPANFILIATSNPCPCGYYGTSKTCVCTPSEIQRYQKKISGPIIDRIDLYVDVDEVKHESLLRCKKEQQSFSLRKNVIEARQIQKQRFKNSSKTNSELTNREIKSLLTISEHAENLLNKATERLKISARSYMRTIKVAQTIADLDGSDSITELHIGEALQYRKPHTDVL